MQLNSDIRQFYFPIQPTVKQSVDHVIYSEFLPDIKLQNLIYCYWQLKTEKPLSKPFIYSVVADGCIDIFFELDNAKESYVMGFCKKFIEFPLDNTFNYIGIRFLPTMFPQLFKINAKEFSNKFVNLEQVNPNTSHFIGNNLSADLSKSEIKSILDNYFIDLVSITTFDFDSRLYEAIQIILKKFGVVDISKDLNTGISSRQLRRLFEYYIGDTPKTFSKVVRFQNILRAKPSSQSLRQNKLFYDAGFYDQAHFIKDFSNFYGVTPCKAFGR